ncbi:MAG TPA: hypothetical protein VML54_17310, partial [Candidatus Limnocylindrales bacterium]|nr:hypothetical protein [Candidatus Limnocylindrales bacterium]
MRLLATAGAVAVGAVAAAAALGAFSSESAAAGAEGITVRGEWKVEIVNPDGSLASVHEFENAFNGAIGVTAILAHASSAGRYWLTLSDTGGAHP